MEIWPYSHIPLITGKIFISENQKNKPYHKILYLISEIFVNDEHLLKQVQLKRFEGQQILSEHFSWMKISPATSEMREWIPSYISLMGSDESSRK